MDRLALSLVLAGLGLVLTLAGCVLGGASPVEWSSAFVPGALLAGASLVGGLALLERDALSRGSLRIG